MRKSIEKTCRNCGADDWYVYKSGNKTCKPCKDVYNKQWAKDNRDKATAIVKRYNDKQEDMPRIRKNQHLKRKYGISIERYEEIFAEQGEACAICKVKESIPYWHLDHNHETGAVRGLLCSNCNLAIGHSKEDIDIINGMIAYLRKWDAN